MKQKDLIESLNKIKNVKAFLITGNEEMKNDPSVDNCIVFHHTSEIQSHSILYPLLNDKIINIYRNLKK